MPNFVYISDHLRSKSHHLNSYSEFVRYNIKILMPKIEITIVPKEVGELWDQILQQVLKDVCSPPTDVPLLSLNDLIPHSYNPKYKVYHGKCHHQYTSNLCGYHAIFNTLCLLNLIRRGHTQYNIMSGASFWMFKKRVEQFLFQIKRKHQLGDEWPWRENDILHGDFQRTYNKLCLERFQEFQIFRSHNQFEFYSYTWEFQYQNLIVSQEKKRQLNRLIQYFISYNSQKPLIIGFMLAITNHWMCLNAIKIGNQTQYWFFDSSNKNFLDLSQQEIHGLVQEISQQRTAYGKPPLNSFQKKNRSVRFSDTQISLKLIIDCLQGRATIDQYSYNQLFNIFANPLQSHWTETQQYSIKQLKSIGTISHHFQRCPCNMDCSHLKIQEDFTNLLKLCDLQNLTVRKEKDCIKWLKNMNYRQAYEFISQYDYSLYQFIIQFNIYENQSFKSSFISHTLLNIYEILFQKPTIFPWVKTTSMYYLYNFYRALIILSNVLIQ